MYWRPIQTAPRDGTAVDLWTSNGQRVADGYFDDDHWQFISATEGQGFPLESFYGEPTHWMPRPVAPTDEITVKIAFTDEMYLAGTPFTRS